MSAPTDGWIAAATKAAIDLRQIVTDKPQRDSLRALLITIGINASAPTLKSIVKGSALLLKIADEAILYAKTGGDPLEVDFTADLIH